MSLKIFFIIAGLGALTGLFINMVLKKHTFGNLWGAVITGIIGAYIGHFLLDGLIYFLKVKPLDVNVVAALIGSFSLVWILSRISP